MTALVLNPKIAGTGNSSKDLYQTPCFRNFAVGPVSLCVHTLGQAKY